MTDEQFYKEMKDIMEKNEKASRQNMRIAIVACIVGCVALIISILRLLALL